MVHSTKTMNSYKFDKNSKSFSTSKTKKSGISGFLRNSWMKGKQLLGLSETEKRIPYRTKPHKSKFNLKITKDYNLEGNQDDSLFRVGVMTYSEECTENIYLHVKPKYNPWTAGIAYKREYTYEFQGKTNF